MYTFAEVFTLNILDVVSNFGWHCIVIYWHFSQRILAVLPMKRKPFCVKFATVCNIICWIWFVNQLFYICRKTFLWNNRSISLANDMVTYNLALSLPTRAFLRQMCDGRLKLFKMKLFNIWISQFCLKIWCHVQKHIILNFCAQYNCSTIIIIIIKIIIKIVLQLLYCGWKTFCGYNYCTHRESFNPT